MDSVRSTMRHANGQMPFMDGLRTRHIRSSEVVPPARRIQHPHETVPGANCWFLPLSMLCGVAVIKGSHTRKRLIRVSVRKSVPPLTCVVEAAPVAG